jgi:hypothetical protein
MTSHNSNENTEKEQDDTLEKRDKKILQEKE